MNNHEEILKADENRAGYILRNCRDMVIDSDEKLSEAYDLLKKIKLKMKEVEDHEKSFTRPLNDTIKKLREVFKGPKAVLEEAKIHLEKEKIIPYVREAEKIKLAEEQERKRKEREELERKQEELLEKADTFGSERFLDEAVKVEKKISGISIEKTSVKVGTSSSSVKKIWTYEIVDPELVPRNYCDPAPAKLRSAMNKGVREIPGVRIFQKDSVSSR